MAYERVHDLKTNTFEMIDFVPVNSWNSTERIYDNQLVRSPDFKDHLRPAYPVRATLMGVFNTPIYSHDVSDFTNQPAKLLCNVLPQGIKRNGDFTRHMMRAYTDVCKTRDEIEAARLLQGAHDRLTKNGYSSAMADDDIRRLAEAKSRQFTKVVLSKSTVEEQFSTIQSLLDSIGLSFKDSVIERAEENNELFSLVNRGMDENWLVRQLRRKCAYEVEQVARDLALVQRHKQVYCSDFSVMRHRDRVTSNEIVLENTIAYDEADPSNFFTLGELAAKSVSNSQLRRNEMFARLNGFERIAQNEGHDAVFYTTTTPSRFHAVSGGVVNSKWIEAGRPDAKQAHSHLIDVWQSLGKILAKKEIKIYGMRIAEPHQDGTPHHHFLLFMQKEHRAYVTAEFKRLALADSPNEKGASKYRFKAELIDFSKGSAVGYVAKYISKNVDGKHITDDKGSKLDGIEAAERVVTWARVNQIRQFQFIGGPSVTVWRELRRLREEFKEDDAMLSDLSEGDHLSLEAVRRAADDGDWEAFCYAMGGIFSKRKDQKVKASYSVPNSVEALIASGGEYSSTRFGDAAQGRINGLMFEQVFLATRFRNWKTENKAQFLRSQKTIMSGVVDWFDALEKEKEYERMCDKRYAQYEQYLDRCEQLEALIYSGSLELNSSCSVGVAPPDWMH